MGKLKSRKLWLGVVGTVLPVAVQALTSGVGWQAAVALSTAAAVTYMLAQGHVDAATASAGGRVAGVAVEKLITKVEPSEPWPRQRSDG